MGLKHKFIKIKKIRANPFNPSNPRPNQNYTEMCKFSLVLFPKKLYFIA